MPIVGLAAVRVLGCWWLSYPVTRTAVGTCLGGGPWFCCGLPGRWWAGFVAGLVRTMWNLQLGLGGNSPSTAVCTPSRTRPAGHTHMRWSHCVCCKDLSGNLGPGPLPLRETACATGGYLGERPPDRGTMGGSNMVGENKMRALVAWDPTLGGCRHDMVLSPQQPSPLQPEADRPFR